MTGSVADVAAHPGAGPTALPATGTERAAWLLMLAGAVLLVGLLLAVRL